MNGILKKDYAEKRKRFSTFRTPNDKKGFLKFRQIINRFIRKDSINILDCGCADGNMKEIFTKYLQKQFIYTGIEYNCNLISKNRSDIICGDIENLPLKPENKFDIIILSAVLEHIKNKKKTYKITMHIS